MISINDTTNHYKNFHLSSRISSASKFKALGKIEVHQETLKRVVIMKIYSIILFFSIYSVNELSHFVCLMRYFKQSGFIM